MQAGAPCAERAQQGVANVRVWQRFGLGQVLRDTADEMRSSAATVDNKLLNQPLTAAS